MTGTTLALESPAEPRAATVPFPVQWFTWPILLLGALGVALHAIASGWSYNLTYSGILAVTIVTLVTLEFLYPLKQRWRMTFRSFLRDLKYLAGGGITIAGINALFGLAAIEIGRDASGPLADLPLWQAVPLALLVSETIQYWAHRAMHEMKGPVGRFLWRVHAAHHLPDRVYVFMHAAGHPLNALVARGFAMLLPLWFLGVTAETALLFNVINNVQGLVSHLNVDLRAGWFNYLLTGTELHRYHHSADPAEGKNYAVTLALFDVLFGTHHYRPGSAPENLGVAAPEQYPDSNAFWRVMVLPFRR